MRIFRCCPTWQRSWSNNSLIQRAKSSHFVLTCVTQNHRTLEAGRDFCRSPGPTSPCSSRATLSWLPRPVPSWVLSVSQDVLSTASLGKLCQCLVSDYGKGCSMASSFISCQSCPENKLYNGPAVRKTSAEIFIFLNTKFKWQQYTGFSQKQWSTLGVAHCHLQLFTVNWWIFVPCFMLKGEGQQCIASLGYLLILFVGEGSV